MDQTPKTKRRKIKIFISVILLLVIIRLILPYVILHYANKTLANMEGYYGHIQDIDLAIYRGAYQIDNIYLNKVDSGSNVQSPFFDSRVIDLSIEWKALFHGSIVGELVFTQPSLIFSKEKVEPAEVAKDTSDFRNLLKSFMPLRINRFEIDRGEIHYIDSTSVPVVNIKMEDTFILARNLTNAVDTSSSGMPADVTAKARIYRGTFDFSMRLNPLAKNATFDMNAQLKNVYLPDLNDFFKAYAKVDVNKGTFGMYTEFAAKDNKFVGYVKPLIQDLDILGPEDRHDSFFHKVWEGFAGSAAFVLSNWKKDQFATKIPFKGELNNPDANIWSTIWELLKNAFVSALQPSLDNDISIATVDAQQPEKKNLIQKIFGKKDDKNVKDSDKKEGKKENSKKKK